MALYAKPRRLPGDEMTYARRHQVPVVGVGFDAGVCASGSALTHAGILAGLIAHARCGRIAAASRVLFIRTGGQPARFASTDRLGTWLSKPPSRWPEAAPAPASRPARQAAPSPPSAVLCLLQDPLAKRLHLAPLP